MTDIRKNPEKSRYEVVEDGEVVGRIEYKDEDGKLNLVHTEVDPSQKGKGLGDKLASFALDDVRSAGRTTKVECEFIQKYLTKHPEYADLVES